MKRKILTGVAIALVTAIAGGGFYWWSLPPSKNKHYQAAAHYKELLRNHYWGDEKLSIDDRRDALYLAIDQTLQIPEYDDFLAERKYFISKSLGFFYLMIEFEQCEVDNPRIDDRSQSYGEIECKFDLYQNHFLNEDSVFMEYDPLPDIVAQMRIPGTKEYMIGSEEMMFQLEYRAYCPPDGICPLDTEKERAAKGYDW